MPTDPDQSQRGLKFYRLFAFFRAAGLSRSSG